MAIKWGKNKKAAENVAAGLNSESPERVSNRLDRKIISDNSLPPKRQLLQQLTNRKVVILAAALILVIVVTGSLVYWHQRQRAQEIADIPNPNNAPIIEVDGEKYTADYMVAEDLTEQNTKEYTLDEQISMVQEKIKSTGGSVELYKMLAELHLAKGDKQKAIGSYERALQLLVEDPEADDEQKKMLKDYIESLK